MRLSLLALLIIGFSVNAIDTPIIEMEFDIEKTADNLENSKKQAIDEGKIKAISYVCEKYNFKTNLSSTYIDDCIDSYSIKSEKFIGETYKATISYKVDIGQLQNCVSSLNSSKSDTGEASTVGYLLEKKYPIAVINTNDLHGGFSKLENILGAAFYNNLYAVTANSLKLYATDEVQRALSYNNFSYVIEYSE